VVNCNVASASVIYTTCSFMALYKFAFNLTLTLRIDLTRFELSEDLGMTETTKPRQDAVDLELIAAIRRLRDDVT